jgi:hypothetical protein
MTYTREQLIDALCAEHDHLYHDDFDPDRDLSTQEYRLKLESYSDEDLINETQTDEFFPLDLFIRAWT